MIARLIAWSARNLLLVFFGAGFAAAAGIYALAHLPLDAIPDLSDTQVIVYTEYPGQAPQVIEQFPRIMLDPAGLWKNLFVLETAQQVEAALRIEAIGQGETVGADSGDRGRRESGQSSGDRAQERVAAQMTLADLPPVWQRRIQFRCLTGQRRLRQLRWH